MNPPFASSGECIPLVPATYTVVRHLVQNNTRPMSTIRHLSAGNTVEPSTLPQCRNFGVRFRETLPCDRKLAVITFLTRNPFNPIRKSSGDGQRLISDWRLYSSECGAKCLKLSLHVEGLSRVSKYRHGRSTFPTRLRACGVRIFKQHTIYGFGPF